jgi:hypothetical protein
MTATFTADWPDDLNDLTEPGADGSDDPAEIAVNDETGPPVADFSARQRLTSASAFPTGVLPPPFRNMVRAVAANKQVPEELPALFGLAAIATIAAPYLEIARGSGWTEPLNIYTVVAMDSGTGKTPAEKDVSKPLWEIEKRMRTDHAALVDSQLEQLEVERANADRRRELEEERASPPDLILGSDSTVEKISEHMSRNGGCASILDSEGELFPVLAGRYNGGVPNIGVILKAYDGDRYKVGRIGRKQGDIDRAVLTLGLAVQPVVLEDAVKNKTLLERGLLARFLFALPPSLLGTRADEGEPYDFEAMRAWRDAIVQLWEYAAALRQPEDGSLPRLTLSPRARAQHVRFCGWIERRLHPDNGDLGNMPGWAAKHKARALRIAGLLHLIDGRRCDVGVSEQTMLAAIDVCRWAVGHAVEVFRATGALQQLEQRCGDVLAWIRRDRPEAFVARDVARKVRTKWASEGGVSAISEVLTVLCEDGALSSTPTPNRAGHVRAVYRPHPLVFVDDLAA